MKEFRTKGTIWSALFPKMDYFLAQESTMIWEMTTEADILQTLRQGQLSFSPLSLRLVDQDRGLQQDNRRYTIDAVIEAEWDDRSWTFAVEIKRLSTPKVLQDALAQIRSYAKLTGLNPLIIVPYLSRANIEMLESVEVSGIDLCGNGFIIVKGELLIARSGNPNRFPQSTPIRNVYRGDSSMVARAFLARPEFRSISDIATAIRELGGDVTLPTVSKVIKVLEGDLIVSREQGAIRLLQPDKLLDALSTNYRKPTIKERFVGKVPLGVPELQQALAQAAQRIGSKFVLTGTGSVAKYAVMGREPVVSAYCSLSTTQLIEALPVRGEQTDRFPNVDLINTTEAPVYFDSIQEAGVPFASPVQTYLELSSGEKREQETAEQVRATLLSRIGKAER